MLPYGFDRGAIEMRERIEPRSHVRFLPAQRTGGDVTLSQPRECAMTAVVEKLKPTVEAMTFDELTELAGLIDDRLLAEPDDAFLEELERRRIAFENGSSPSRLAEDVIRDMRARFA